MEELRYEERHSLYCSPSIVRAIKSRRLRWTGHIVRMEEGRNIFIILTDKPTTRRHDRRKWEYNN